MDLLRSCYKSSMAPYPDKPGTLIAGAWHWSPPGAKWLPFPTAFCSAQWDPDQTPAIALGEQPPRGAYSLGAAVPAFQGQHFCGSSDVWLNGQASTAPTLPVDAKGIPLCCQPVPYDAHASVSACGCGVATLTQ
jgi:hypothetical protein